MAIVLDCLSKAIPMLKTWTKQNHGATCNKHAHLQEQCLMTIDGRQFNLCGPESIKTRV
jgi:hypothetical protein